MAKPAPERPFDDIRALVGDFPSPDREAIEKARRKQKERRPQGPEFGVLEDMVEWLASWQGGCTPAIQRPGVAIFASAYGAAIELGDDLNQTHHTIKAIHSGAHPINRAASEHGAGLRLFDLASELPSQHIGQGATFSEAECAGTIAFGMEAVAADMDLMVLSDAGCGTNFASQALLSALLEREPAECAFNTSAASTDAACEIIAQARQRLRSDEDSIEKLAQLGARETAAQVGAIMAARIQRIPVLLDGPSAILAALVVRSLAPAEGLAHCQLAASGIGQGAEVAAQSSGLKPLMDLSLEHSCGLAGTLALGLMRSACDLHAAEPAD